jgi:hypothetical protein
VQRGKLAFQSGANKKSTAMHSSAEAL